MTLDEHKTRKYHFISTHIVNQYAPWARKYNRSGLRGSIRRCHFLGLFVLKVTEITVASSGEEDERKWAKAFEWTTDWAGFVFMAAAFRHG